MKSLLWGAFFLSLSPLSSSWPNTLQLTLITEPSRSAVTRALTRAWPEMISLWMQPLHYRGDSHMERRLWYTSKRRLWTFKDRKANWSWQRWKTKHAMDQKVNRKNKQLVYCSGDKMEVIKVDCNGSLEGEVFCFHCFKAVILFMCPWHSCDWSERCATFLRNLTDVQ